MNNPYKPEYQRPDRGDDPVWSRRRDPIADKVVREMTRRGY